MTFGFPDLPAPEMDALLIRPPRLVPGAYQIQTINREGRQQVVNYDDMLLF